MNATGSGDGREGTWVLREPVLRELVDCAQSDAAIYGIFETNPKTGGKLRNRLPVKQNIARKAATQLIKFYAGIVSGKAINSARFYEDELRAVAAAFVAANFGWKDLIEDVRLSKGATPKKASREESEVHAAA